MVHGTANEVETARGALSQHVPSMWRCTRRRGWPQVASRKGHNNVENAKDTHGFTIRAVDGEIGTVDHFYFDDETWAIRYLMVDTGGWLVGAW